MSKTVHVILQRDVAKLGKGGEVVKVASGYARNYLLPEVTATFKVTVVADPKSAS